MRIKVFTDMRFTSHPRQTGVGKHIRHMVGGLAAMPGNDVSLLMAADQEADHKNGSLGNLPSQSLPLAWKPAEALWTLTGHPLADRDIGECDWVYCPKNDFIPAKHHKVAVTVHGAHELDPDYPRQPGVMAALNRTRMRLSYQRILDQAALVLSVSEFLAAQMVSWFGVPREKIAVVGNGVEQPYFDAALLPDGCSGRPDHGGYILCVGGLNRLDGGDHMLDMAGVLRANGSAMRVVLAGSDHEPDLLERAARCSNVELLHYVPAARLCLLMRDALALYYPSRYETFGIAAAEAMAAGLPVISVRSTAIPEVLGDAGIYSDSAETAAELALRLERNPPLRESHLNLGRQRARRFSWAGCVSRLSCALAGIL